MGADELRILVANHPEAELVSALDGVGMEALRLRIALEASAQDVTLTLLIPFAKGSLMRDVHERCQVIAERYVQEGLLATVRAPERMAHALEAYAVEGE